MTIRRFYAPPSQFDADRVWLEEDETRHLHDVLRLKAGDRAQVFDGEGHEFECVIETIEKRNSTLNVVAEIRPPSAESPLDLTLAVTLLKGDKLDAVVQKAVELGVNCLIPMTSARCDVKVAGESKRTERWRRIAMEATKQCGRAKLIAVEDLMGFQAVIEQSNDSEIARILFSERDGKSFESLAGSRSILAFIGPEGGWDDSELELAKESGIQTITFGGRVMKADTAAISIASILQHRFGDMN
jgi:16S rRNA (uracil1498-N3)-methyltransferase